MYDVTFPRVDDTPTWTVSCLFVAWDRRGTRTSVALLNAAAEYAAGEGAVALEGYPRPPGSEHVVMRRARTR
jgi:GNAT superfamily N-acetyltransferase